MALAIALRSSRPFQFFFSTRHRSYVRSVYARRRLRVHPCLLTIQHGRTFFHLVVSIFSFSFLSFSFFLIPVFRSGTTSRRSYSTELPFQRVSSYCSGYRSTDSSVVQAKNVTRVIAFACCAFHPLAPHRKLIALKSTPRLAAFPLSVDRRFVDVRSLWAIRFPFRILRYTYHFFFSFSFPLFRSTAKIARKAVADSQTLTSYFSLSAHAYVASLVFFFVSR